jgi:transposase
MQRHLRLLGGILVKGISRVEIMRHGIGIFLFSAHQGIRLEVVKLPDAKKGFVLLPRRWVVERSFGWAARFRRLVRDYERLPETLKGLHSWPLLS